MDLMGSTITLASVITIGMFVLGILTYFSNKKRNDTKESEEDKQKAKDSEARLVRMEIMLVNIEKNTSNLTTRVDSHDKLLTKHETQIAILNKEMSRKNNIKGGR